MVNRHFSNLFVLSHRRREDAAGIGPAVGDARGRRAVDEGQARVKHVDAWLQGGVELDDLHPFAVVYARPFFHSVPLPADPRVAVSAVAAVHRAALATAGAARSRGRSD